MAVIQLKVSTASGDPYFHVIGAGTSGDGYIFSKLLVNSSGAAVAFGAGNVGATVPRVTVAADDPQVLGIGAVGDSAITQGSTGSISAKLRLMTSQLNDIATSLGLLDNAIYTEGDVDTSLAGFPILIETTGDALTTVRGDATNGVDVDVTRVNGQSAHDSAIAGAPVRIGLRSASAEYTALSTGETADAVADLVGRQVVRPHTIPELQVSGATTSTGNTAVNVINGVASNRIYVTTISVANSSSTNTIVTINDGVTAKWYTAVPANGGSNITFDPPLRLTAGATLTMTAGASVSTMYMSANGFLSTI